MRRTISLIRILQNEIFIRANTKNDCMQITIRISLFALSSHMRHFQLAHQIEITRQLDLPFVMACELLTLRFLI